MITEIHIERRTLPERFANSRTNTVLDEIEMALLDDGGVHARAYANSVELTIKVATNNLVDTVATLKDLGLIS
jgi:hypothetical protein